MEGIIRVNNATRTPEATISAGQFAKEALRYKKPSEVSDAIKCLKLGYPYRTPRSSYLYFSDVENPTKRF